MGTARTEFRLLGDVQVEVGGSAVGLGHARQRCVLVALLVDVNRIVSIDAVVDRVWADRPPDRARSVVYSYVSRLRGALSAADDVGIERRPGGYRLTADPMSIDLHAFHRLVARARDAEHDQDRAAALQEALSRWRGPAFSGLDTPWLTGVRVALERDRMAAQLDSNDLALRNGRHDELLGVLMTAAVDRPLDERLAGQLMLALYRADRQAEALEHFAVTRSRLADELGIDPSLPLRRLHQQILAQDPAIAAPTPPGPIAAATTSRAATPAAATASRGAATVMNIAPRNPFFTGRTTVLHEIDHRLCPSPDSIVVASLFGLGGVGKSQVALEFAHRHRSELDVIWWIDAEQPVLIPEQFGRLARLLGLPRRTCAMDTVPEVTAELARRGRWLLVFDNAGAQSEIAQYLPAAGGRVLVTSRSPAWGSLGHRARLDVWERSETVALLRSRIPSMTAEIADRLATELGDLPLATAQAIGYMESTAMEPADYLRRFVERRSHLLSRGAVFGYQGRVDTTWDLSLARLETLSPAALSMLRVCAFLAPDPIPLSLFAVPPGRAADDRSGPDQTVPTDPTVLAPLQVPTDQADLDDCVGAAVALSMVRRHHDAISIHRLVQATIAHRLTAEERPAVLGQVVALLIAAHPGDPDDPANWPALARLAPHVLAAAGHLDGGADSRRVLLHTLVYLTYRGDPPAARRIVERLLDAWRGRWGDDHPDLMPLTGYLMLALIWDGDPHRAQVLGSAVLPRARRVLGADHPEELRLATYLVVAQSRSGLREQARALGVGTVARVLDRLDAADPERHRLIGYLTLALVWTGDAHRAHALSREAFGQAGRCLGPDHPTTLFIGTGLALASAWVGDIATATAVGDETFARAGRALGPDHLVTPGAAAAVAQALALGGEPDRARTIAEIHLPAVRDRLGPDHVTTLIFAATLSWALAALGEPEQAGPLSQDTCRRAAALLGHDHPITILSAAAGMVAGFPTGNGVAAGRDDTGPLGPGEVVDYLDLADRSFGPNHPVVVALRRVATTPAVRRSA